MVMRGAQIDPTLCFLTTFSLYALLRHLLLGPAWGWYFIGGFAAGLGVFTKGVGFLPVLVLIPLLPDARASAGRAWPPSTRARSAGAGGWRRSRCCSAISPVVRAHALAVATSGSRRIRRLSRRNPVQADRRPLRGGVAPRQSPGTTSSSKSSRRCGCPGACCCSGWCRASRRHSTSAMRACGCRSSGCCSCWCSFRRAPASAASTSCRRCPRWRSPRCHSSNRCWRARGVRRAGFVLGGLFFVAAAVFAIALRRAREVRAWTPSPRPISAAPRALYVYLALCGAGLAFACAARAARGVAGGARFARHRVLVLHRAGDERRTLGQRISCARCSRR